jgi:hypothetical protein
LKEFWHTLHSCGHAAFWSNINVAADMHLKRPCPWCLKPELPNPSVIRDRSGLEVVTDEGCGAPDEIGTVALFHHRRDRRCCAIQIAATIGANESNELER